MSLGYAEKLSYIEDVGKVGMAEFFDPPHILQDKIKQLTGLIKEEQVSPPLVVYQTFVAPREFGLCRRKAKPYQKHRFHFIVQHQA